MLLVPCMLFLPFALLAVPLAAGETVWIGNDTAGEALAVTVKLGAGGAGGLVSTNVSAVSAKSPHM